MYPPVPSPPPVCASLFVCNDPSFGSMAQNCRLVYKFLSGEPSSPSSTSRLRNLSLFASTLHSAVLAQNCRLVYKLLSGVPSHPSPTSRLHISTSSSVHLSLFVRTFHSAALTQNCRLLYKSRRHPVVDPAVLMH